MLKRESGKGLFSKQQRGFRPAMSGCGDNTSILRKVEEQMKCKGGELYALFVDFRNAFGAADHQVIWLILRWFNVPEYIVQLLISVYDGAEVKFRFGEDELTQAMVLCGVLQGDVLSPSVSFCAWRICSCDSLTRWRRRHGGDVQQRGVRG